MSTKKISSALISVYDKKGIDPIVKKLHELGITIYSTGGTKEYIEKLNIPVIGVEEITHYPSLLEGRVKTLHPAIFGGILFRRNEKKDQQEITDFNIPPIDLVIVDLYPFHETLKSGKTEEEIIEKIDIGGVSLIRAAAKNFQDVLVISSRNQYSFLLDMLTTRKGISTLEDRKKNAGLAFQLSATYDSIISDYFANRPLPVKANRIELRYGENPHQEAIFLYKRDGGDADPDGRIIEQLNGKDLSYNNLVDIDASIHLIQEFEEPTFAIIKHTNPCGIASASTTLEAYQKALRCDPLSAFGGVLISNHPVDLAAAKEIHSLFFEVLIAPEFSSDALTLLSEKKNRIILKQTKKLIETKQSKSILNGTLFQDIDYKTETIDDLHIVTKRIPSLTEKENLVYINKIAKHAKSNAIALGIKGQLFALGCGQTSRIDALKQAIQKATQAGFDLTKAALASDAFFPFPDCVEIAAKAGIQSIIQPGGSIKDQASIDACNEQNIAMVFTGFRHFKH